MGSDESFHAWAGKFEWLSDLETLALPPWQERIAFVYQFVLGVMGDGAGSLFYNHTEKIEHVARSFDAIEEPEFAARIRRIESMLQPMLETQDELIYACLEGVAAADVSALDAAMNEQLADILSKLKATAEANGWAP